MNNGKLIILSAPSGAGKTTLVKYLLKEIPQLRFSVSCATRNKRENEVEGKDYYFILPENFKQKITENAFVEWEEVYPNSFYGTLLSEIERIWNEGKHVAFDIDVKGGINLKNKFGEKALSIFIQPPNISTLAQRLKDRNTESEDKLKIRIDKAEGELEFAQKFDRIIINDDLETAQKELKKVVSDFLSQPL